jgi:hypothetical protein
VTFVRATAMAGIFSLVAAACASDATRVVSGDLIEITDAQESTAREDVPSALSNPTADGLPRPLVDPAEIISGGPPPDGIPPIDEPLFLRPRNVDFLADNEPVVAIEVNGDARAYPVQIMTWHEIVNDTIGGTPVTVSYCPLCNTALAYDRRLGNRILDFGTSGSLYRSALVMYDRQTESLWSHFSAEAIAGHLTEEKLEVLPMAMAGWAQWRDANPDGLVLSRETGHSRNYGTNPYQGYDDINSSPFLFRDETDDRLLAMTRIVGVQDEDDALGVQLEHLLEGNVVQAELGARDIVVWATPGTASALDTHDIAQGRDVGTTGVFESRVGDQALTFESSGEGFRDNETGSTWNVFGEGTGGPLEGERLQRVVHVDTFWFAWAAFLPDSTVVPPRQV